MKNLSEYPLWAKAIGGTIAAIIAIMTYLNSVHAPIQAVELVRAESAQAVESVRSDNVAQDRENIRQQQIQRITQIRSDLTTARKFLKSDAATKYFYESELAKGVKIDQSRLDWYIEQVPKHEQEVTRLENELSAAIAILQSTPPATAQYP